MAQLTGSGPGHGSNYAMVDDYNRLHVAVENGSGTTLRLSEEGYVITLTEPHQDLRLGNSYRASWLFDTIPTDGIGTMYIKTGSNHIHFNATVGVDGDCEIGLYGNPIVSAIGSPMYVFNMNTVTSNITNATWTVNPVVTNSGNFITTDFVFGGSGANPAQSSKTSTSKETNLVLGSNSPVLINFINRAGRDIKVNFTSEYTEGEHV